MFSVIYLPASSLFVVPSWISIGIFMGVVGASGWLSVVLPKHPKCQRVLVATALAVLLSAAVTQVGHKGLTTMVDWMPYCDSWAYYTDFLCWFAQ